MSEEQKDNESSKGETNNSLAILYQALMSYVIHQDRLVWGRVGVLTAVQGAVLISGYQLGAQWLAAGIMFLGAFLTFLVYMLVILDIEARDVNRSLMDEIAKQIISDELAGRAGIKERDLPVRLTSEDPPWRKCFTGRFILSAVLIFFAILDIVIGSIYLYIVISK